MILTVSSASLPADTFAPSIAVLFSLLSTAPKSLAARLSVPSAFFSMISILPEAPVSSAVNVKLLVVLEKLTLTPTSLLALISVRTVSSAVSLV